jgi:hypothetical protein
VFTMGEMRKAEQLGGLGGRVGDLFGRTHDSASLAKKGRAVARVWGYSAPHESAERREAAPLDWWGAVTDGPLSGLWGTAAQLDWCTVWEVVWEARSTLPPSVANAPPYICKAGGLGEIPTLHK